MNTRDELGSAEETKANNIYDLAGNVCEWTTEAALPDDQVFRGGGYSGSAFFPPSYPRTYDSPDLTSFILRLPPSNIFVGLSAVKTKI